MIKLAENFRLSEFTKTDHALYNEPMPTQVSKLLYLAQYILQPIREQFGEIKITSGFRSQQVNEAVGGSITSQHLQGEAADIIPIDTDIETVFSWAVYNLTYGQCINERKGDSRWIHISLPRISKPNQTALVYVNGEYTHYEPVSYEEGGA